MLAASTMAVVKAQFVYFRILFEKVYLVKDSVEDSVKQE